MDLWGRCSLLVLFKAHHAVKLLYSILCAGVLCSVQRSHKKLWALKVCARAGQLGSSCELARLCFELHTNLRRLLQQGKSLARLWTKNRSLSRSVKLVRTAAAPSTRWTRRKRLR